MPSLNFVLIGDPEANKTQILKTFLAPKYHQGYTPDTVENDSAIVMVNNKVYTLGLQDISTQEQYDKLILSSQSVSIFLLLFSVVHPTTFNDIKTKWLPKVVENYPNVPIVLVGANISHRDVTNTQKDSSISSTVGTKLAKQMNAVAYLECSPSVQNDVRAVFEKVIVAALSPNPKLPSMENLALMQLKETVKTGNLHKAYEYINLVTNLNFKNKKGVTLLEQACNNGHYEVARMLLLSGANVGSQPLPADVAKFNEHIISQNAPKRQKTIYSLKDQRMFYVTKNLLLSMQQYEQIDMSENALHDLVIPSTIVMRATSLVLSSNKFRMFPQITMSLLKTLDLSHNNLTELPSDIPAHLPCLETLNVAHNKLENIPTELAVIKAINAEGNPLSNILPAYRNNNEKIMYFLRMTQGQQMLPWSQVKLVLVGQEGVGKTTLLGSLQDPRYKCVSGIGTNGIQLSSLILSRTSSLFKASPKDAGIQFNVWDCSGHAVCHSTHRFFITTNTLYLVLYDMSKPETIERVKYWIEQIESVPDPEGSKPILIVGTHADKINRSERAQRTAEIAQLFPTSNPRSGRNQLQGHFVLGLTTDEKGGLADLRTKVVDIALTHPKIGINNAQVPKSFTMMQKELEDHKRTKPFLQWNEYTALAASIGISSESMQNITSLLHVSGFVVWQNTHKLRDLVIIDPQWLIEAMAGIVAVVCQILVSKYGGIASWKSLKMKFPNPDMHATILQILELYEIVYRLKGVAENNNSLSATLSDEQVFFIPSLLMHLNSDQHKSILHWQQLDALKEFTRRFSWPFFPTGFFPRLLVQLVHLRLRVLACWIDACVVMARDGSEWASLQILRDQKRVYLEIKVKAEGLPSVKQEPLIAELSYIVARVYMEMYSHYDLPIQHEVVVTIQNGEPKQMEVPFEDCIRAQLEGNAYLSIDNSIVQLDTVSPDLSGCSLFSVNSIIIEEKIKESGLGAVHRAKLLQNKNRIDVTLKELQLEEENNAIQGFQHAITIMSKLNHENLVKFHGTATGQLPLQMAFEYIQQGDDLYTVIKTKTDLTLKWKLKVAIDCAAGLKYLHSQNPPVFHCDLRAPNIYIVSLAEDADVTAKLAEYAISQQVFPFTQPPLHNITETAPETWDTNFYDEKCDVFSFSIILWRLFGSRETYKKVEERVEGEQNEEYAFLMENGKYLPPLRQREVIKKGGRLEIHLNCPPSISLLIRDCWKTNSDSRPFFPSILSSLIRAYTINYSEDPYIMRKKKELLNRDKQNFKPTYYLQEFTKSSFTASTWKAITIQEDTTVTSLIEVGADIWMGNSSGWLLVLDTQSRQVIRKMALHSSTSSPLRGIKVIGVGNHLVWAAVGSEIHIFSSKTYNEIAAPLMNHHLIVSMTFLQGPMTLWVADTYGGISIWDVMTMQKSYRFQIHTAQCAQSMDVLHDVVYMAVGRDIVAVFTNTMERVVQTAHKDRIHHIIAIPHTNQVWTCARDGGVRVWKLETDQTAQAKYQIKLIFEWSIGNPVKTACMMSDGIHVCTGAFDGTLSMWDIFTFKRIEIRMPDSKRKRSVLCVVDTEKALWCGFESKSAYDLTSSNQGILCHPHAEVKSKIPQQICMFHKNSRHDFYIGYSAKNDGSSNLFYPAKLLYETLSARRRKKTNELISTFLDLQCIDVGQNWERSCLQNLFHSRMIILLISPKRLEEIAQGAGKQQENALLEYEYAILVHESKGTPVVPLFMSDQTKKDQNGNSLFSFFDPKSFDPFSFPLFSHSRGNEAQTAIDHLRKTLPSHETDFLVNFPNTIDQLKKLYGMLVNKKVINSEQGLNTFVTKIVDELERV